VPSLLSARVLAAPCPLSTAVRHADTVALRQLEAACASLRPLSRHSSQKLPQAMGTRGGAKSRPSWAQKINVRWVPPSGLASAETLNGGQPGPAPDRKAALSELLGELLEEAFQPLLHPQLPSQVKAQTGTYAWGPGRFGYLAGGLEFAVQHPASDFFLRTDTDGSLAQPISCHSAPYAAIEASGRPRVAGATHGAPRLTQGVCNCPLATIVAGARRGVHGEDDASLRLRQAAVLQAGAQ